MKKFDDVDIAVLKYHNIPYIAEAYKIFYGEYPTFEDKELEYQKIQHMISILTEYNIKEIKQLEINPCQDFEYNDYKKISISQKLHEKIDILESKIKDVLNLENELEELSKEKPLSKSARRDIRIISYLIKQEIEKRGIKDPIEFLTQISDVLNFRKYPVLVTPDSPKEMANALGRYFVCFNVDSLEYKSNDVMETVDFINSKLRLGVRPRFGECSTEEIIMLNNINNEIFDDESYSGLLSKENNKKLIR